MEDVNVLAHQLKSGNCQAFRQVYEQHSDRLYGLALKYLKDPELAHDAVQDLFTKLWDKRAQIDPSKSLEGLLSTMLKNLVLNMIRSHTRRIKKHEAQILGQKRITENEYWLRHYSEAVFGQLNHLPPARQKIVRLKLLKGLDNQTIAEQLNLSVNTVKFQISQGIKSLRNTLLQESRTT